VADDVVYVSKLLKRALLDAEGTTVGSVSDVVIGLSDPGPSVEAESGPGGASRGGASRGRPMVRGFLASVQHHQTFVAASRIGWLDARGIQMATGTVDLRRFRPRGDELLARKLLAADVRGDAVRDIGFEPAAHRARTWVVTRVALQRRGPLRARGAIRVVDWQEVPELFEGRPEAETVRAIRRLHPSDAARELIALAPAQRVDVIDGLSDHFLAEVLEELPEPEQVGLLDQLELERAADVVDEMDPDDATDLLAELESDRRQQVLGAIEPARRARLRRLLSHDANSAGGLMTSDPIIAGPDTPVAEALARIRSPEVPAALAAQVFLTDAPHETPTGTYLGLVTFQRLLREAPATAVGHCIDVGIEPIGADLPELAVAQRLAAYDLLAVPVCDEAGRLLGAVTVDDVLDRSLPPDWRQR
jgi:CBS domain-containing protein